MDQLEIKATMRIGNGKGPARELRRQGRIPAVLYGPETEPTSISVDAKEMERVLKTGSPGRLIVSLDIQNNGASSTNLAMLKEVQIHPLSGKYLHADFYAVSPDRKISVMVPIITTGKSKGVELGGMLQVVRREIEILCYPNEVPKSIVLDVTDLDIGDSIHVKEIPVTGDIEIPSAVNFTVLTILGAKRELTTLTEEEEEAEEEAAEE